MRFWDTSAVLPLIIEEDLSEKVRGWLDHDSEVALWGLTRVELASAIERRVREGRVDPRQRAAALRRAADFADGAHEVTDLLVVRAKSIALLARHALRAADAAQLGAALVLAEPDPASVTMVVLDQRLADAALREGLEVVSER